MYRLHLAALQHPGIRCLIVRKTAVSLGSTTLVTFEQQVIAASLASRIVRWFGGSPREAPGYRYSNGSRIVVGGMDKPEKVLSSEWDLIFCDEATELTETDWEILGTRLRHGKLPWQQQIAACNPAHPQHWLNQRANSGRVVRLLSRHEDNPAYVRSDGTLTPRGVDYMAKLDALSGIRRMRYRDGRWASADGVIYEQWDPAVHLIDRHPIPDHYPRFWAIDFGYTNPFVCQFWAEDPDGRLIMYREIYMTRRLVEDHAAQILQLVTEPTPGVAQVEGKDILLAVQAGRRRWTEPRPRAVVCDHDAEGRATLERHTGLSTTPAHKAVTEGIQAFDARLKVAGDGRPRLVIMRDSVVERDQALVDAKKPACTSEEIPGYVWAVKPGGDLKEEPLKVDDHGCDGGRYLVAHKDLGRTPRMRWLG